MIRLEIETLQIGILHRRDLIEYTCQSVIPCNKLIKRLQVYLKELINGLETLQSQCD